jgi:hypothetical protein
MGESWLTSFPVSVRTNRRIMVDRGTFAKGEEALSY